MSSPADDAVVYPVLSDDELAIVRRYGTVRQTAAGEVLFSPADDCYDLIVVLSGSVAVADDEACFLPNPVPASSLAALPC
jgi:hypothetical protein